MEHTPFPAVHSEADSSLPSQQSHTPSSTKPESMYSPVVGAQPPLAATAAHQNLPPEVGLLPAHADVPGSSEPSRQSQIPSLMAERGTLSLAFPSSASTRPEAPTATLLVGAVRAAIGTHSSPPWETIAASNKGCAPRTLGGHCCTTKPSGTGGVAASRRAADLLVPETSPGSAPGGAWTLLAPSGALPCACCSFRKAAFRASLRFLSHPSSSSMQPA
mmetsp:Transcript_6529/g.19681  ORF Transcript_6529/g.19681 Transcript_6529/m.19681 type:complete len:218 (-) Transcript_6529:516-1169(-)|eukprot:scaffold21977_cov32-Tisochrysis_lutea.AAC.2